MARHKYEICLTAERGVPAGRHSRTALAVLTAILSVDQSPYHLNIQIINQHYSILESGVNFIFTFTE